MEENLVDVDLVLVRLHHLRGDAPSAASAAEEQEEDMKPLCHHDGWKTAPSAEWAQ